MTTYAIYQETENGLLRVGTFTPRNATSVRHIAEQFFERCPNMPREGVSIAKRIMGPEGKRIDSSIRLPLA